MRLPAYGTVENDPKHLCRLLRAVLDDAPMQIAVRDRDGTVLLANKALAADLGPDAATIVGQPLRDVLPSERAIAGESERLLAADEAARRSQAPLVLERSTFRGGRPHHYRVYEFGLDARSGISGAVASLSLDVTEQTVALERLDALTQIGAALADASDIDAAWERAAQQIVPRLGDWCNVWFRDSNGGMRIRARHGDPSMQEAYLDILLRRYAAEDFPLSPAQTIRTGDPILVTEVEPDAFDATARTPEQLRVLHALDCASYVRVPIVVRGVIEGALTLAVNRVSGRRYQQDDVVFFQEIAARIGGAFERHDLIRDRDRAIDDLERANEALEARVAERTEELARKNDALVAARTSATSASEAKSRFLAQMSHEIRTPLNGILGMATLLRESGLDARQKDSVDTLRSSGEALLTILNEILDFSEVEAGRVDIEHKPFDVRACVTEALDLFRSIASAKGLRLECHMDADVPKGVSGDAVRVRQVLSNLVGNALKFTAEGRVDVRVSCEGTTHEGRVRLRFAVRDTGMGISDAEKERLFIPFSQADESTSRVYGGSGLGLAIAKQLVELMSGSIRVQSVKGQGSTFVIWLPFERVVLERPTDVPQPAFDASMGRTSPLRILVVDDNRVNQKVATRMLERFGYDADVAADGTEAVSAATDCPYDLIFMDVQMPVMNGLDATRRIRALPPERGNPRVVAMTAGSFEEDRRACLDAGMGDFVSKPVRATDLARALQRAVDGAVVRKVTRPPPPLSSRPPPPNGLDPRVLEELATLFTDPVELAEIVARFVGNARRAEETVEGALKTSEPKPIYEAAHILKASAGMIGAMALSDLYMRLMADSSDFARVRALVPAIRAELDAVIAALPPALRPE